MKQSSSRERPNKCIALTVKEIVRLCSLITVAFIQTAHSSAVVADSYSGHEQALLTLDITRGNCINSTEKIKNDGECITLIFKHDNTTFYRGASPSGTELQNGNPAMSVFAREFNQVLGQANIQAQLQLGDKNAAVKQFYKRLALKKTTPIELSSEANGKKIVLRLGECTSNHTDNNYCASRQAGFYDSENAEAGSTIKNQSELASQPQVEISAAIKSITETFGHRFDTIDKRLKDITFPTQNLANQTPSPPAESEHDQLWLVLIMSLVLLLFSANWLYVRKTLLIYFRTADKKWNKYKASNPLDTTALSQAVSEALEAKLKKIVEVRTNAEQTNLKLLDNSSGNHRHVGRNTPRYSSQFQDGKAKEFTNPEIDRQGSESMQELMIGLNNLKDLLQRQTERIEGMSAETRQIWLNDFAKLNKPNRDNVYPETLLSVQRSIDQLVRSFADFGRNLEQRHQSLSADLGQQVVQATSGLGQLKAELAEVVGSVNKKLVGEWRTYEHSYDQRLRTQTESLKQSLFERFKQSETHTRHAMDQASQLMAQNSQRTDSSLERLLSGLDNQEHIQEITSLPLYRLAQTSGIGVRELVKSAAAPLHGVYDSNVAHIRRIQHSLQNDHTDAFSQYCAYVLTHTNLDELLNKTHLLSTDQNLVLCWLQKDQNQFVDIWTTGYGERNIVLSTWMRIEFLLTHIVCPAADDLHHQIFELKHHVSQISDLIRIGANELSVQIHDLSQDMSSVTNDFYTTSSGQPILMSMIAEEPKFAHFLHDTLETKSSSAVIDVEIWGFSQRGGRDYFAGKRSVLIRKSNLV